MKRRVCAWSRDEQETNEYMLANCVVLGGTMVQGRR